MTRTLASIRGLDVAINSLGHTVIFVGELRKFLKLI